MKDRWPTMSRCRDHDCPSRRQCLRYVTPPDLEQQAWLADIREDGWTRCSVFVEVWPGVRVVTKETV